MTSKRRVLFVAPFLSAATWMPLIAADGAPPPTADAGLPNLTAPTLGGTQFWCDERILGGWRIQRNMLTGHCRLLDDRDRRQAWGTFEACAAKLDEARQTENLLPARGEVVVVLHGLASGRWAMQPLVKYIRDAGFDVVDFGYPTTQGRVADHAAALARIVGDLKEAEHIHFVTHSLGAIVVRHYLADQTAPETGRSPDPRIQRIVMLAPPNQGSARARVWNNSLLFTQTMGPIARELGDGWPKLEPHLAVPDCEFGVIAGGLSTTHGYNLFIPGDDDGTLGVSETRLAGARDFAVVASLHSLLIYDDDALAFTTRFLQHGCFVSEDKREPIPPETAPDE